MVYLANLFSPIKIGKLIIKNRLVMPAMSVNFGVDKNGFVNNQLTEYFVARAKGGTGMLVVGGGGIDPKGHELPELPALWNKKCVTKLKIMTQKVKKFGTMFGMQLMHGGRQTPNVVKEAPSAIAAPAVVQGIPIELSITRIHELINSFGNSAKYCQESGFDFVEIHAAHGYLINQFLAPNSNFRSDMYGGSYNNRIRFLLEIIENIKSKTQDNFCVGVRLNGEDYIKNGWNIKDSIKLASILELKGINYLNISAGVYGSHELTVPSMYVKQGCFMHLAHAIKKRVSIPIIAVGRIRDPEFADMCIQDGKSDMVAMGRAHLADPDIAIKASFGHLKSIKPCIGCCLGCIDKVISLEAATCVVNPKLGREYQLRSNKILTPKKLLIIGSGISGLAAARKAASRGHKVVIIDKAGIIGGRLKVATIPPFRSDIMDILSFFASELDRLNVEIRLNTKISKNIIREIMPDEILVAAGSLLKLPIIKGLSKTRIDLCDPLDILTRRSVAGKKTIILGGNQVGLFIADYLSEKGKEVIVLHRKNHFAEDMARNDRFYLRKRLGIKKVKLYKNIKITELLDNKIFFYYEKNKKILNQVDTCIISEKVSPVTGIHELFKSTKIKVHSIGGNSKKTDSIINYINDAWEIARTI